MTPTHRPIRRLGLGTLLVLGLLAASCASFGPKKLQSSHLNYNKAVQMAQMEEDLLNIVRLRYLDMPVSLKVSSISAQTSFSVGCYCETESRCHRSILRDLLGQAGASLRE